MGCQYLLETSTRQQPRDLPATVWDRKQKVPNSWTWELSAAAWEAEGSDGYCECSYSGQTVKRPMRGVNLKQNGDFLRRTVGASLESCSL